MKNFTSFFIYFFMSFTYLNILQGGQNVFWEPVITYSQLADSQL